MKKNLFLLSLLPLCSMAAGSLFFDEGLLRLDGITDQQIDDAINQSIPHAGVNRVSVFLNQWAMGTGEIFYQQKSKIIGISPDILKDLQLKKSAMASSFKVSGKIYIILNKEIRFDFNRANNTIRILVPATLLLNPSGLKVYSGGAGAMVNYNVYSSYYRAGQYQAKSISSNYELGLNLADVSMRSHGFFSEHVNKQSSTRKNHFSDFYADKKVAGQDVRVGRFSAPDSSFGSGYIDGATLSSANRGGGAVVDLTYNSPEISMVEFWQNGQLVWQQRLEKGPNQINNVPVLTATTDVTAKVKINGRLVDTLLLPRARIKSVSSGEMGYYLFAGKSIYDTKEITVGAGINNKFSDILNPAVSLVARKNYQGLSLSNSATIADVGVAAWVQCAVNEANESGLNLVSTLTYRNTSFNLSKMSRKFTSPGQALYNSRASQKQSISVSQSVRFSDAVNASVTAGHYEYYTQAANNIFSLDIGTRIKKVTVSAGVNYNDNSGEGGLSEKLSFNLRVLVPLYWGEQSIDADSSAYHYAGRNDLDSSLTARVNDTYSVSAGQSSSGGNTRSQRVYINNYLHTPYTNAAFNVAQDSSGGQKANSVSASFNGAVAINRAGIIFSPQSIESTYAVVETGINEFVGVISKRSRVKTNHDGKAIVPSIAADKEDFIKVDPTGLSSDIVVRQNRRDFISNQGSVSFFKFEASHEKNLLLHWVNKPDSVSQSDEFYNKSGQFLTRFIDTDVLMVNQNALKTLLSEGMTRPANLHQICRLETDAKTKQEEIVDVYFTCTP